MLDTTTGCTSRSGAMPQCLRPGVPKQILPCQETSLLFSTSHWAGANGISRGSWKFLARLRDSKHGQLHTFCLQTDGEESVQKGSKSLSSAHVRPSVSVTGLTTRCSDCSWSANYVHVYMCPQSDSQVRGKFCKAIGLRQACGRYQSVTPNLRKDSAFFFLSLPEKLRSLACDYTCSCPAMSIPSRHSERLVEQTLVVL